MVLSCCTHLVSLQSYFGRQSQVATDVGHSLYSYEFDGVLNGCGHLATLGMPVERLNLEGFTDSSLRAMAADGWDIVVAGIINFAYYMNEKGEWWKELGETMQEDVATTSKDVQLGSQDSDSSSD